MAEMYCELSVSAQFLSRLIKTEFATGGPRDKGRRAFARAVESELSKPRYRGELPKGNDGCSHSLVNALANGSTRFTHPARADAMEQLLNRSGELFRLVECTTPTGDAA